jgi:hypothetical protein
VIVMLPVPLLTGNEVWHAVQFDSPGAFVYEALGPDAEAETFWYSGDTCDCTAANNMAAAAIADSFRYTRFLKGLFI